MKKIIAIAAMAMSLHAMADDRDILLCNSRANAAVSVYNGFQSGLPKSAAVNLLKEFGIDNDPMFKYVLNDAYSGQVIADPAERKKIVELNGRLVFHTCLKSLAKMK
ncbi:MAG: hypothetical protein ACRCXB_26710 [Aeromonadaceae bacterium]